MKAKPKQLGETINARVSTDERREAEAVINGVGKAYPIIKRTAVIRAALRIGLTELRRDATLILGDVAQRPLSASA